MTDFWRSSGFHLLTRDSDGRLVVTDDFLRAYFRRPEMRPTDESCAVEIALHDELMADPRRPVPPDRLARLADADARENYRVVLAFRDLLVRAGTVEACYLDLFRHRQVPVPPLFVDQLVHVILRNVLDGVDNPMVVRAGEPSFRAQKVTLYEGAVLLADEETVEIHASKGGLGSLARLVAEAEAPVERVELDVLTEDNQALYWARNDRFDTVLDITFGRPGLDAFCRVLEAWVRHMLGVEASIEPVGSIRDERWRWHVGLDAEATAILNDLYNGAEVDEERLERIVALFRFTFRRPEAVRPDVAGRPIYLAAAMAPDGVLRLKPQNLLINLPLAAPT